MKLSQLFIQTFDPILKQHQFHRIGHLFYRVNGTILQGICLNACNPFLIDIYADPYWCYRLSDPKSNYQTNLLKKGFWVDAMYCIFGFYYQKDHQEECQSMMNAVVQLVDEQVIPFLDKVDSENVWLKYQMEGVRFSGVENADPFEFFFPKYKPYIYGACIPHQYLLLWQAYQDQSFEQVAAFVKQITREYVDNRKQHLHVSQMTDAEIEDKLKEEEKRFLFCHFNILLSKIQENDLDWIKEIYDTETSIMKKALKDELKIEIS